MLTIAFTYESREKENWVSEDKNKEMTVDDFSGNAPSSYLFGSGAAIYFDEKGKQIVEFQRFGISALRRFVERFPYAPVYWSIWRGQKLALDRESVKSLLRYLKEDIDIWEEVDPNVHLEANHDNTT